MDKLFEEVLIDGDKNELNELKRWLFEENIRLAIKQKELDAVHEKVLRERIEYEESMKAINLRNVNERKRLKDEEEFFDKKLEILKNGFNELNEDRKRFEKEKKLFEREKAEYYAARKDAPPVDMGLLFAGVNNILALKKRYRDLLKIFHPDNMCGDNDMVALITKEYERLRKELDYPFKSVK